MKRLTTGLSRLTSTLLVLATLVSSVTSQAQDQRLQTSVAPKRLVQRNTLSVELLGRGVLYSLNYDRLISPNIALGAGVSQYSFGYTNNGSSKASLLVIPLYANMYFNESFRHRVYGTAGADLAFASASGNTSSSSSSGSGTSYAVSASGLFPTVGFGYEFRPQSFLFRLAGYGIMGNGAILPWLGLSLGTAF